MIAPGLIVASRSSAPAARTCCHAACSAIVFERDIRRARSVVAVGPVGLGVWRGRRAARAGADCGDRRRHRYALDAGVERGAQHPQRAIASRHDQLVRVLGLDRRKGRGHVQHVPAAGDRLGPTAVGVEIRGETVSRSRDRRSGRLDGIAHRTLTREIAHGRPHVVAPLQQRRRCTTRRGTPCRRSRAPFHRSPSCEHPNRTLARPVGISQTKTPWVANSAWLWEGRTSHEPRQNMSQLGGIR